MKYFNTLEIHCIEELKKVYFTLAQKIHPDHGGSEEEFKELNAEYQKLFPKFKDIHKNIKDRKPEDTKYEEYYTAKTPCKECAEDFIKIVSMLLTLDGISVELCGRWLYIRGNTRKHKELLKNIGCSYAPKKSPDCWTWHYKEDSTPYWKGKKAMSMTQIRTCYGSKTFVADEETLMITGAH